MKIRIFASGSSGNCLVLSDADTNILIDAGISLRRITDSLAGVGLTMNDIRGVLITHEHSDHISGLPMLVKRFGVKIYAPGELCEVLAACKSELSTSLNYIRANEAFCLEGLNITPFRTPHDSHFSFGYRVEGDAVFAFATDTGCVTEDMLAGLNGAEAVVIEANHDVDMLRSGPYPFYLKRRILSDFGHLSNFECGKLALHLANSGTRHIILGHLSRENNTPELAYCAVKSALADSEAELFVAPMDKMLEINIGETVKCSE